MASRVVFFGADRDPSLLYEECSVPQIQEGEILAKILVATICGSDIHTISGKRVEAVPSVLGHEAVAEVLEVRRRDTKVKVGDRITFSIADSCYHCHRCRSGLPQKCSKLAKYGHLALNHGTGFTGCYASHIVLQSGTAIFTIPSHVTDKMAAPINCALATLVNAVSHLPQGSSRKKAVIQGAGMLGLYGCALLKERGYGKVYVSDVKQDRLVMVSRFGGIPINPFMMSQKDAPHSVDVVLEVCGNKAVVPEGLALLQPGGVYVFVGMVHPDSHINITAELLIRKCLTLIGIHNYAPEHLEEAVEFISSTAEKYPYEALLSPEYALKDITSAIQMSHTQKYLRVALRP